MELIEIFWTTIGSIVVLTVGGFFKLVFELINCKDALKRIENTTNNTNSQVTEINTKLQ